jgi:hypothetical protein
MRPHPTIKGLAKPKRSQDDRRPGVSLEPIRMVHFTVIGLLGRRQGGARRLNVRFRGTATIG